MRERSPPVGAEIPRMVPGAGRGTGGSSDGSLRRSCRPDRLFSTGSVVAAVPDRGASEVSACRSERARPEDVAIAARIGASGDDATRRVRRGGAGLPGVSDVRCKGENQCRATPATHRPGEDSACTSAPGTSLMRGGRLRILGDGRCRCAEVAPGWLRAGDRETVGAMGWGADRVDTGLCCRPETREVSERA